MCLFSCFVTYIPGMTKPCPTSYTYARQPVAWPAVHTRKNNKVWANAGHIGKQHVRNMTTSHQAVALMGRVFCHQLAYPPPSIPKLAQALRIHTPQRRWLVIACHGNVAGHSGLLLRRGNSSWVRPGVIPFHRPYPRPGARLACPIPSSSSDSREDKREVIHETRYTFRTPVW